MARRPSPNQLALLEVETDPSRVGTLRSRTASPCSLGNSALRLKSVEGVERAAERSEVLTVLLRTWEVLSECGWVRGPYVLDRGGAPRAAQPGDGCTLVDAVNASPVTADRWHARLLLQRIAGHPNLVEWNTHPYRQARDVEALLDKAIRELGGRPPATEIREAGVRRRGGWSITTRRNQ